MPTRPKDKFHRHHRRATLVEACSRRRRSGNLSPPTTRPWHARSTVVRHRLRRPSAWPELLPDPLVLERDRRMYGVGLDQPDVRHAERPAARRPRNEQGTEAVSANCERESAGTAYRMLVRLSHAAHRAQLGRHGALWAAWINPHKGSDFKAGARRGRARRGGGPRTTRSSRAGGCASTNASLAVGCRARRSSRRE